MTRIPPAEQAEKWLWLIFPQTGGTRSTRDLLTKLIAQDRADLPDAVRAIDCPLGHAKAGEACVLRKTERNKALGYDHIFCERRIEAAACLR